MKTANPFHSGSAGRAGHLTGIKPADEKPGDDASDPLMSGYCPQWALQRNEKARTLRLDKMSRGLSAGQQPAFLELRKGASEFADARAWMETDMSGASQAMLSIIAQEQVWNDFLSDLEQCEAGRLPAFTAEQAAALDRRLDEHWQRLVQHGNWAGTIRMGDVRETQEIWLRYRAAWAAFGRARHPLVAAHAWQAVVTERRIVQLQGLLANPHSPGIVQA